MLDRISIVFMRNKFCRILFLLLMAPTCGSFTQNWWLSVPTPSAYKHTGVGLSVWLASPFISDKNNINAPSVITVVWFDFLEVSRSQILLPVTVLSPSNDESTLNLGKSVVTPCFFQITPLPPINSFCTAEEKDIFTLLVLLLWFSWWLLPAPSMSCVLPRTMESKSQQHLLWLGKSKTSCRCGN